MVLLESLKIDLGTKASNFSLPAVDGRTYSLADFADKKALVIVFMCNHCPYVQAILDRLIAIQKDYGERGVQVVGINPNEADNYPEDSFENMKVVAEEKGINFAYLRDESQEVAKAYGAQCTPDVFVYDEGRKLAYHGRIDDNWQEPSMVRRHELKEALDALLEGKDASREQFPSMGCSIKWR